jgi:uridine kinase
MDDSARRPSPATLARGLCALPPSCGPVRLVGIDGHAGSGKSTFAARLAAAGDREAPVLHLDDIASHDELFAWTERLRAQVLEPLSRGRTAVYGVYDWTRRDFTGRRTLPPEPVVLLEGVGAGRRALRPHLAALLWMDVPAAAAHARGRRRDGLGQAAFWDRWIRGEEEHFRADPSRPHADLLVRQLNEGFEMRTGQAGRPSRTVGPHLA